MKLFLLLSVLVLALLGCTEPREKPAAPPPTSVAGEKLYDIRGVIKSRNAEQNEIVTDHEKIEGFMEAMTMPYEVRGARVSDLPPDGTRFMARLHVTDDGYWLTDVQAAK